MGEPGKTVVMRKPPTLTVRTMPAPTPRRRTEIMSAPRQGYWALIAEAARLEERGEIRRTERRTPVWSHERGEWILTVVRLKDAKAPMSRRRKIALAVVGAATVIGGLFSLGWWALSRLDFTGLASFAAGAVAVLLFLLWLGRNKTGGSGTVTATAIAVASVTVRK